VPTTTPAFETVNDTFPLQSTDPESLSVTLAESGTDEALATLALETVVRDAPLSSFVIVNVAVLCEPRIAPFVGFERVKMIVSSGSRTLSFTIGTVNVFVTSPKAKLITPLVGM
jgi:hypothetical protein